MLIANVRNYFKKLKQYRKVKRGNEQVNVAYGMLKDVRRLYRKKVEVLREEVNSEKKQKKLKNYLIIHNWILFEKLPTL